MVEFPPLLTFGMDVKRCKQQYRQHSGTLVAPNWQSFSSSPMLSSTRNAVNPHAIIHSVTAHIQAVADDIGSMRRNEL
jgi:hypothetical protein